MYENIQETSIGRAIVYSSRSIQVETYAKRAKDANSNVFWCAPALYRFKTDRSQTKLLDYAFRQQTIYVEYS